MSSKKDNYINRDFSHDRDKFDSNISLQARAYIIAEEIAKGTLYRQIVKKYMDEWGVSYNYMHSIITESINMFNNEDVYKKLKDINVDRLTNIYAEARQQGDLDVAIKAVDKLIKLLAYMIQRKHRFRFRQMTVIQSLHLVVKVLKTQKLSLIRSQMKQHLMKLIV